MTKRIFAVVIAIAMVCTMFAFVTSAAENTFYFDKSANYAWSNYLNVVNVIDDGNPDLADLRADGTPYKVFLNALLAIMNDPAAGAGVDGTYMNSYKMEDGTLLYDYVQDTFGAFAYVLRGGKQKAVDYWNSKLSVALSMNDNGYTYTTAATQTAYDKDAYQACLSALQSYMTTANDNYCFNVENGGKRYLDQKAKFETLCSAIDACAVTTPAVEPESTVTLPSGANYTWYGYLNVVNVIPDTEKEGLRAEGTPYKVFLTEMLAIMNDPSAGANSDAAYMNAHAMSDGTLLKDYVQDTYGAYAYVLRGGRQKAADYWNSKLSVALTLGNNSYTYTNAGTQTAYDATAYQAAVDALNDYMANTGDASCFDVENGGGRFFDQRTKYNALVAAVDACAATAVQTLVDFTGVTTPDATLTYLITMYNNVDVESIKADADVQNWAKAIKEGIEAGLGNESINVGSTNVVSLWETTIRYTVKLNAGARTAADEVMNNNSLWPLGAAIADLNQTTYKTAQYNEVYNLWVQIRDDYRGSTTIKTSEVIAACESLKAKIQALEVANYKFTQEQKDAYSVLKVYVPIYRGRVERVVLDSNKATDIYKNYVALVVKAEGYLALDWENGTSESYPSVEEMHALIMPEAMGGSLENDWYPFRQAFGLDNNGYDTLLNNTYNAWVESGKYTDDSLAAVKAKIDNFEAASLSGNRGSNNTDAGAQEDIEYYQAFLVEKPVLPPFKVASASLSLGESIAINFRISADVNAAYSNIYGIASCDGDVQRIEGFVEADGRVKFTYSNLTPKMAKVPVTFTLYGTANGTQYTKEVEYSVYRYCSSQYNKTTDANYKTLLTDFLNYATALQIYTAYRTDDLANAGFDQTYASATLAEPVNQLNAKFTVIENPAVKWNSVTLAIRDTVNVRLKFTAADINGLTVKFVINGVEIVKSEFTPIEGSANQYYVYFGDILPKEMRTPFTATVYKDGVAVSNTLQYSIQSYVVGKTTPGTNLNDLVIAMLKFGDACAAYFNK